ncbi:hypothetical protein [Legionella micdadei]|uniref:Dot/Icm secretion system substrate n=1 Tax=Legionella micdadei TaxID=451 RepID=A0A098GCN5_LEGMI|nr:hypothetical protein [Legionella micdadei]ARG98119.1 hypothetical protein B6N58_10890 [Legionella micdadei]ARH00917.1 hypothetical protein B6V88_11120 [Legionella micdadei]KTD30037.1 hypothetical protein Lmic_0218 [Legionella micdadei]NSL18584.1 hypothetical protein [Legionella micdadei]CEG60228.1 conserved protein of unknown function [coiled-coil domain] [Legionella micdadei]
MTGEKKEEQVKDQEEKSRAAENALAAELLKKKQTQLVEEPPRKVILDGKKKGAQKEENDFLDFYNNWLKKYKKDNPEFKEEENKVSIDQNGCGCINFTDPKAEEDFVRELAKTKTNGVITDKGIPIATFRNGDLIDLRTQKPFPEGGYAHLVSQLDQGIPYSKTEIKLPEASHDMASTSSGERKEKMAADNQDSLEEPDEPKKDSGPTY